MSVVVLDSTPVGLLCRGGALPQAAACRVWLDALLAAGRDVVLPEIADYEVRRELLRLRATAGLARLDALALELRYLPLNTAAVQRAARLWADVRRAGRPTASPDALDGDVILAAQALGLPTTPGVVIATGNVRHLSRFAPAADWATIAP